MKGLRPEPGFPVPGNPGCTKKELVILDLNCYRLKDPGNGRC